MVFAVLKHEDAVFLQDSFLKHKVWNLGQVLQGIGRVGKDKVELLVTALDKAENIGTQGNTTIIAQLLNALADEAMVVTIHLDADHLLATTRHEFQGNTACAREQIEGCGVLEVNILRQHIKDVFFGKVRRRSRLERTWNVEVASLIFSGDNPHSSFLYLE